MIGYFVGMLITAGVYLALNYKFKWLTYEAYSEPCGDSAMFNVFIILGLLAWPLTLVVLFTVGMGKLLSQYVLPRKK